jgi:hypothetical protein
MKGAILGFEKVREAFANVGESVSDLSYEVRSEMGHGESGTEIAGGKSTGRAKKEEGKADKAAAAG